MVVVLVVMMVMMMVVVVVVLVVVVMVAVVVVPVGDAPLSLARLTPCSRYFFAFDRPGDMGVGGV